MDVGVLPDLDAQKEALRWLPTPIPAEAGSAPVPELAVRTGPVLRQPVQVGRLGRRWSTGPPMRDVFLTSNHHSEAQNVPAETKSLTSAGTGPK